MSVVPYSVLDLVPVPEGGLPAESFRHSLDLARHAERWGYHRYWLAEHHNMPGIASAATAVLIGHLAGGTTTLRLGAGGIMLPNHSPLVIAEQFGTLSSLYPARIDLGLGRAPGSDQRTMQALRRQRSGEVDDFPADVRELMSYFGDEVGAVQAVPGQGLHVPIWLLGSSLFSAQLAAHMGLPYAFASHFAPRMLHQALDIYRRLFQPSARLARPYAIVGVPVVAAPTDEEAQFLASSTYQRVLGILTGQRGLLRPPVAGYMAQLQPHERAAITDFLAASVVGGPGTVRAGLQALADATQADEFMLVSDVFDPQLRLRSLDITAQAWT